MTTDCTDDVKLESLAAQEVDNKKIKIGEGVFLATATAGAYIWAFGYELGYTTIFNIPRSLISINLTSILITAAFLFPILLFVPSLIRMYFMVNTLHGTRKVVGIVIVIAVLLQMFLSYVFGYKNWFSWFVVLAVGILISIPILLVYWLDGQQKDKTTIDYLRSYLDDNTVIGLGIVLCGFFILLAGGWGEALRQEEFLVLGTTSEMAVLRIYGETVIAAPFDRVSKQTFDQFVVLKIGDASGPIFTLEAVGPLRPPSLASYLPSQVTTPTIASPIATPTPP